MTTNRFARLQVLLTLAVACLIWPLADAHAGDSSAPLWETDVAAACTRARAEAKPLVVYLYSSDGEEPTHACRQFESETLSSPALPGFRVWTVMTKIDRSALVSGGTAGEMLRAINVTESPAVIVVVHHTNGWQTSGQNVSSLKPSDFIRILRVDVARAMIAIRRDEYRAMSKERLARRQANLVERCMQLQRESTPIANAYDQQLDALRDDGKFNAGAFAATAQERRRLLRRWISAVAEVAAMPEYADDSLVEIFLDAYLLSYDVSARLESGLAAVAVDDRLPDPSALRAAQELLLAATQELEQGAETVHDSVAGAGQKRDSTPPDHRYASPEQSKAGASHVPARSGRKWYLCHRNRCK